jgi:hypothetical protein
VTRSIVQALPRTESSRVDDAGQGVAEEPLLVMRTVPRSARHTGRRLIVATAVLPLVLVACGESAERSLCPSYEQFLVAREVIRSVDAESATAAEAIEEIDEFRSSVLQLRENSDGRFRSAVDDLDAAISDVLLTLESVDPDEDYSTWAPLVEDDVETAQDATARVAELIAPQCAPAEDN